MEENILIVAGTGPGKKNQMTLEVLNALEKADVIVGYTRYVDLLRADFPQKIFVTTPMHKEAERCRLALENAASGKKTVFVCGGDPGVYSMAGLLLELQKNFPTVKIKILPGVTACTSGAALLGAPLIHDFAVISLSDALTPWEKIEERLRFASRADFCIVLYNPQSHRRSDYLLRATKILLETLPQNRPCGIAESIGRDGEKIKVCTLSELQTAECSMAATVFIGNSQTRIVSGKLVTPRGYSEEFLREEKL